MSEDRTLPDGWHPDADMNLRHVLDNLVEDMLDLQVWRRQRKITSADHWRRRSVLLARTREVIQTTAVPREGAEQEQEEAWRRYNGRMAQEG
jgi:hypothetical protein